MLRHYAQRAARAARRAGARVAPEAWAPYVHRQSILYTSQFVLPTSAWRSRGNRIAFSYFHGLPDAGASSDPDLAACFDAVRREHPSIDRLQVSHRAMRDALLEAGVPAEKVFLIPIAVDIERFPLPSPEVRLAERRRLGLPDGAFVVGSMQKDGVGWGEGLEPKPIKGPDVLAAALESARARIPDLHVLLTGPARGYVRRRLTEAGVPHTHVMLAGRDEVARAYGALDAYLVASRDEGGPQAALEAMASGVPLVTTRVGQAADIVVHGENGWVADVGDAAALAELLVHVRNATALDGVLERGRATAVAHSWEAQEPLWREFLTGFVALESNT